MHNRFEKSKQIINEEIAMQKANYMQKLSESRNQKEKAQAEEEFRMQCTNAVKWYLMRTNPNLSIKQAQKEAKKWIDKCLK